jgi:hypothetical protein
VQGVGEKMEACAALGRVHVTGNEDGAFHGRSRLQGSRRSAVKANRSSEVKKRRPPVLRPAGTFTVKE